MSYTPIKIREGLLGQRKEKARVEGLKEQIKDPSSYAKSVAAYHDRVTLMLWKECQAAEKNCLSHEQYLQNHKTNMEHTIHSVEALLKNKEFDRFAYQEVNAANTSFPQIVPQIMQDDHAFEAANREYREDWVKEAKALFSPDAMSQKVAELLARRQAWLGREAERHAALTHCQEYVVRIHEYFKQAVQRMNRIEKDENELENEEKNFQKDVRLITVQIESEAKTISQVIVDAGGPIKGIRKFEAAKTWDDKIKGTIKPQMVKLAGNVKIVRGHLKTCEVLLAGLQKRGQACVPALRTKAVEVLRNAQQSYIEAMKKSKVLEKDETECATICKNHGVLV